MTRRTFFKVLLALPFVNWLGLPKAEATPLPPPTDMRTFPWGAAAHRNIPVGPEVEIPSHTHPVLDVPNLPFGFIGQGADGTYYIGTEHGPQRLEGGTLLKKDYPELFATLRDTWGAAPPGEFRLPDLRYKTPSLPFTRSED